MNSQVRVQEQQRAILKALMLLETRLGDLYAEYAKLFPPQAAFWSRIAHEEAHHAHQLDALQAGLDAGHVFWNIGRFTADLVRTDAERIDDAIRVARNAQIGLNDAVKTALRMEASLLESQFYSLVNSTMPEYQRIAGAMLRATHEHMERIQAQLRGAREPTSSEPFERAGDGQKL